MIEIEMESGDTQLQRLWLAVADLSDRLPHGWVLVGGLMVQLHAAEPGVRDVRPTQDIDVLGQTRPPGALQSIDTALRADGFKLAAPDLDGYGYRYERDELIVGVLAADGIKPPPGLGSGVTAIGIPGGTQALGRSEAVRVIVSGCTSTLRRSSCSGQCSSRRDR